MSGAPAMHEPVEAHQPHPVNASWHSPHVVREKQFAAGHEKKSPSITHPPEHAPSLGPASPPALHVPVAPHQPQPSIAPHASQSVIGPQSGGSPASLDADALASLVSVEPVSSPPLDAGDVDEVASAEVASAEVASAEVASADVAPAVLPTLSVPEAASVALKSAPAVPSPEDDISSPPSQPQAAASTSSSPRCEARRNRDIAVLRSAPARAV
jgi:hypothetical protein